MAETLRTYYEFFAGGGMAHAGLGDGWNCVFANDFDPMKAAAYAANWGGGHLVCGDVAKLTTADLPGVADLAWASFPCQDLSLAGDYAGLGRSTAQIATRSGTFWPFWGLMKALRAERRAPATIVLENVFGALTSHGGKDFAAICGALSGAGYTFGAVVIDAARFVPQSRPRVFFIATAGAPPVGLVDAAPDPAWHPKALVTAWSGLSATAKRRWVWWGLPIPTTRVAKLADLIEAEPSDVAWNSDEDTARLLSMMSPLNRRKVAAAAGMGRKIVGGVYKRTRPLAGGGKVMRAEVRFDDVAGCLRTPSGGSSRQTILVVEGEHIRSRLLSAREAARLMGLDDSYKLPARYNDAYHVAGDGVCPAAVRHIAAHLIEPFLAHHAPLVGLPAAA